MMFSVIAVESCWLLLDTYWTVKCGTAYNGGFCLPCGGCVQEGTMMGDLDEQLRRAVRRGDTREIKRWLDAGADVNVPGEGGMTALMYAAEHGGTDKARLLMNAGARLDVADATGWTALMHAAHFGHEGMVRLLVGCMADVALRDVNGEAARDLAARMGHARIVRLLDTVGKMRAT